MTTASDVLRGSGLFTLGDHPAPDAVEVVLRRLAEAVADGDAVRRESIRAEVVRVLKPHGWRASAVDAVLHPSPAPSADDGRQGRALLLSDPEPWADPVDGAELLDELVETYARFLALPDGAADADALWTVHAHAHDAAEVSPILGISSPTKRCGKSTQLTVIQGLVPRPLPASSITTAALFRTIEACRPTLLVDEADTFINDSEGLRGVLNSGHTRAGAQVVRTVGDDHETRVFSTWAPKAIAMIGDLPDTLRDRSIEIRLRRKRPDEQVVRLRLDRLHELEPLRRRCARWAADHADALRGADPVVPEDLHDRAADNWRPLLAIADQAGGEWPDRARTAAKLLSGVDGTIDSNVAVQLLSDLRGVFGTADRMSSADLVLALGKMEDRPWPEWKQGRPLTARQLARQIQPFGIHPKKIRFGTATAQGYEVAALADAWARYLPADPEQPEQSSNGADNHGSANRNTDPPVPDQESDKNRCAAGDVPTVPDPEPGTDAEDDRLEREAIQWEAGL